MLIRKKLLIDYDLFVRLIDTSGNGEVFDWYELNSWNSSSTERPNPDYINCLKGLRNGIQRGTCNNDIEVVDELLRKVGH